MTVPGGGVISLPPGASTLDTLENNLQNMSAPAMKARAVDRFPDIMNGSTGGSPAVDLTPFGILTNIWAGTNSLVAQADPADIQGPEDLPDLLLQFIEGLPVVGQLVGLVEAILGTYDGNDQVLLTIMSVFDPIRRLMQMITGVFTGFPTVNQVELALPDFIKQPLNDLVNILVTVLDSIPIIGPPVGNALQDLAAMFGLLKTKTETAQQTGEVAQKSADSANVGVALLIARGAAENVPGGVSFHDTFDRDGATPGPNYVLHYFENGGGFWRTINNNLSWAGADPVPRSVHGRVAALSSDTQSGQLVQDQSISVADNQDYAALMIVLRQNAAQSRSVLATIRRGQVEIGCWVDGTYTRFGAATPCDNAAGDRWEFWAGTTNAREFVLFRNGNEALRRTDTENVSFYGADYRYPGPGARAGVGFDGFFPFARFFQVPPPDIQSVDFNDRAAA